MLSCTSITCADVFHSNVYHFHDNFNFRIPAPVAPDFDTVFSSASSAVGIAIVSFAISVSLGQLFAKKHDYEVDSNQVMLHYSDFYSREQTYGPAWNPYLYLHAYALNPIECLLFTEFDKNPENQKKGRKQTQLHLERMQVAKARHLCRTIVPLFFTETWVRLC